MGSPQPSRPVPLRLGCPIQFRDRWQGTLAGVEVDDAWEVLNLVIERGVLRWASRVKLAFSASPRWSYDYVVLDCTSSQAFAREITPIAAPARQLSTDTPLSLPDAHLLGLLVEPGRRRASDAILRRGTEEFRFPVAAISYNGKSLRLGSRGEELLPYLTDEELVDAVRQGLASNPHLGGGDRGALSVLVSSGVVTVGGNVRTRQMKDRVQASLQGIPAAREVRIEVVDDIDLELAIGRALDRAGQQHRAEVYARSTLGEVTLFGRAPSAAVADEIARIVPQVRGVRNVSSRLVVGARPAPAAGAG